MPYFPLLPQTVYAINNISFNESDDRLILIYTDINKTYYYLTFDIKDECTITLSDNGKCDWSYFQSVVNDSKRNLAKIKNSIEYKSKVLNYESNVIRRKAETKPFKTVKNGDFDLILDDSGEIITDSKLLDDLRKERLKIAREIKKPAYIVFNNQQLVALATYKPKNRDEFISLYGLGEGKYNLYGERILSIVTSFGGENS